MNYYPPELADWWMDDWISFVYGKQRTFKASQISVHHHTGAHGRRYKINRANEPKLGDRMPSNFISLFVSNFMFLCQQN